MLAAIALTVALGVGATDSNTIVVRIDGKTTPVTLAGVSGGNARGAAFAKCLVAGRVVRIKGPRSAATATLLDDSSVAAHVAEFMETATGADPCTIGRAAYQTVPPRVTTTAAPAQAKAPAATTGKKPVREVHVSFSGGEAKKGAYNVPPPSASKNEWGNNYRPAPAPRPISDQPTYAAPATVQTYQPERATVYVPPTVGSTPLLTPAPTQPGLQQQGTQPSLQQQGPTPVPTTTYAPPPSP